MKSQLLFKITGIYSLFAVMFYPYHYCKIEVDLQRFEQTGDTTVFDARNVRVRKYNRSTPVLNGTVTVRRDLNNDFQTAVRVAYSRLGNNQFNEYPLKWPTTPFCHMMKDSYRDIQYIFANHSNFPQVSEEGLCPFPQGNYWFKDALFPINFIPPIVQEGYWRMNITISGKTNTDLIIYARLTKTLI
ncbi:uncharacterized protein LOC131432543 [Malaya genurostris]|uniref:uncharacterized protein LOC131432543 n=1 Tax=Malaya genurostris TaxID=325434 RepID=UPI0026F38C24|nr:uncharacterized protein LOC131432543 [Malaya genurostris]